MGCPAVRSAMPSRKMRANFVDLASGMVGLLGLGRTASIVPFLLQIALDIFGPLSLSLCRCLRIPQIQRPRRAPLSFSRLYRARPKYSSQVVLVK